MSVYAKAVKRRERLDGAYLREFDRALQWAETGRNGVLAEVGQAKVSEAGIPQTAVQSRNLDTSPDSSAG